MPFWQTTTFAVESLTFFTMSLNNLSSRSKKASNFDGSSICIFVSVSGDFTSNATSNNASLAFLICLGIPKLTLSLSNTIPSINSEDSIPPPITFSTLILSNATSSLSLTWITAFTANSAKCSFADSAPLPVIAVIAIFFKMSISFSVTFSANSFKICLLFSAANLYPFAMTVGWTLSSNKCSACFNNSTANTTAVVVPSPTSFSWVFATSTIIFAVGCSIDISSKIVTPSFVTTISPIESTNILSMPFGPRVVLTVSATALAAAMLFLCASLPVDL